MWDKLTIENMAIKVLLGSRVEVAKCSSQVTDEEQSLLRQQVYEENFEWTGSSKGMSKIFLDLMYCKEQRSQVWGYKLPSMPDFIQVSLPCGSKATSAYTSENMTWQ